MNQIVRRVNVSRPFVPACVTRLMLCGAILILGACEPDDSLLRETLHRGLNVDPESLHPHHFSSTQASAVLHDLREGLVAFGPNGLLAPGVARSWSVDESALDIEFELRSDARWSNGEPILASDFVRSFQSLVAPSTGSPNAEILSAVENADSTIAGRLPPSELGVEAVNESLLRIQLASPMPNFLQVLTHPSTFPIYERPRSDSDPAGQDAYEAAISNGAYTLDGRHFGSSIELKRNTYYWNDTKTQIDRVVYHIVSENSESKRYLAGELDITDNVPSTTFLDFKRHRPAELRVAPVLGVYFLAFNLDHPNLEHDGKLRAALSAAIDREALVEKILGRGELPAYSFVPRGIFAYDGARLRFGTLKRSDQIRTAKRLLAESNYGGRTAEPISIRFSSGGGHKKIIVSILAMWRDVLGVKAVPVEEEFRVYLSSIRQRKDVEVFRLGWRADYNDALNFLQIFETANSSNYMGYSNPSVDELLEFARKESDPTARGVILKRVEAQVLSDHVVVPLYFYVSKHLVSLRVLGWTDNPLDVHYSRALALDRDFRK